MPLKRGLNTKIYLAVDVHGMPVRIVMIDGTTGDCRQADAFVQNIDAGYLLADNAYESDYIIEMAANQGIPSVIPPKKNRKEHRFYDKHLYKMRHLIKNPFLYLKRWCGIAGRYAKNAKFF